MPIAEKLFVIAPVAMTFNLWLLGPVHIVMIDCEHEDMLMVLDRPQREAVKILTFLESVTSNLQERTTHCRHAGLDFDECIAALIKKETLQKDRTASESRELKLL